MHIIQKDEISTDTNYGDVLLEIFAEFVNINKYNGDASLLYRLTI